MTSRNLSSRFAPRLLNYTASAMCLLIAVISSSTNLCAQTRPVFPVTPFTTTSIEPFLSATADFNSDGLPDIASVSFNSLTDESSTAITLLLATSTPGTYTSSNLSALPCKFNANIVAADLNKDGKADLVLACGAYVVVLLGSGDGTFKAPAYYATASPYTVAVADLSGNGYPDIVVSGKSGQLTVLVNGGPSSAGTFTIGSSYTVDSSEVLTGDFNGDGKVDLAVHSSNWGILYGNGDGTLQPIQNTTATGNAAAVDVNDDGISDLVYETTDSTGKIAEIQTLLGKSSGFVSGPLSTFPYLTPGGKLSLAGSTGAGQFVDLAYFGVGPLSILLGDGQGGFALGQSYVANGGIQPQTTANGVMNLLVSGSLGYNVLTGNGDGSFQGMPAQPVPVASYFAAADLNGDGLTDVISSSPTTSNGTLISLLSRGDGSFNTVSSALALSSQILLPGDFNGDGKMDVLGIQPGIEMVPKGDYLDPQIFFFPGGGDGTFGSGVSVPSLIGIEFTSGATGDFNSDGKLDVVLGYFSVLPATCGLVLLPGNGDGTFGSPITISKSCSSGNGQVLVGDLNGDGSPDAVFGGDVYLGSSSSGLQQQPLGVDGALALGDLNGDGILDLAVLSGNTISLDAGRGNGTFQTTPFYTGSDGSCTESFRAPSIAIGNADGAIPAFSLNCGNTSDNSELDLYLGSVSGVFPSSPEVYILGGVGASFGTFARLNSNSSSLASNQYQDYLGSSLNAIVALLNSHTAPPVFNATSTLLTIDPANSAYGTTETLTATVMPSNATGSVTFMDGSASLGTATSSGGVATLTTSTLPAGLHSIRAVYSATGNYASSTSAVSNVTIAQAATTTTLTILPQSISPLQTVTLTANVSAGATGTVTFAVGSTSLPAVAISNGMVSLQDSSLAAGTYRIVATYSGDANYLGSTSATGSITVAAADFTVSVNPSSLAVTRGQSAQAIFSITPVGGYSGSLTFSCGTLPSEATCSFNPTTVTLNGSATQSVVFTFTAAAPSNAQIFSGTTHLAGGLALGLLLLLLSPRRRCKPALGLVSFLCLTAIAALAGCGGNSAGKSSNPGSPVGTQSVSVTVAGSTATHNVTLPITIQ